MEPRSHEYGSFIINARESDEPTVVYGNVPNTGLITNLPDRCCVELPVLVDRNGLQPTHIGELPPQLAAICRTNINVQELTVAAALSGKREHIYHAVMADPHTAATLPLDKIWAMCDDLIDAHQKEGLLGEFAPTMPNTGRSAAGTSDRVIAELSPVEPLAPEAGSANALRLKIENPRGKAQDIRFAVDAGAAPVKFGRSTVRVQLAANARSVVDIPYRPTSELTDAFTVDLTSPDAGVFCLGTRVAPRTIVTANEDGELPFNMMLDGVPAVDGTLSLESTGLRIQARVEDSKVQPPVPRMNHWKGSRVELSIAADHDAPIKTVYIAPHGKGGKITVTDFDLAPIAGATAKRRKTKLYYTLDVTIPYKALGLKKKPASFLFDISCGLGALGDAHSGGWCSLAGTFERAVSSGHFWMAEV